MFCQRRGFGVLSKTRVLDFFFKDEDLHGVLSKTRVLDFFF